MEAGINAGINAGQKSGVQFKSGLNIKLPQRLISAPDDFSDEMDSITGWTGSAGTTVELNTTEKASGTGSLKFTTASTGTTPYFQKIFAAPIDLSASSGINLRLFIYPHSALTTFTGINIYFFTDVASNSRYMISLTNNETLGLVQGSWKFNYAQDRTWAVAGTPSWANINAVRIMINKADGQTAQLSFDLFREGINLKKTIQFQFDDGNDTDLTIAYPILAAKGYVATSFMVSDNIWTAGHMSPAQLQYLNSKGWDIGNHTKTHPLAPGNLTVQDFIDEMENCRVALDAIGLTRASKDVGYTGSAFCPNWQAAIAEWGGLTGREGGDDLNIYEVGWPHNIHCATNINTTSVAAVKLQIDRALNRGGFPILVFHRLVASNPTTYQWLISQFQEVVDYAYSLGLQSLTISEYRRLSDSAIRVSHK